MSSWSCPHESDGRCRRVALAYCRPGMRGCVLCGKVWFEEGPPAPVWPEGEGPRQESAGSGPAPEEPGEPQPSRDAGAPTGADAPPRA